LGVTQSVTPQRAAESAMMPLIGRPAARYGSPCRLHPYNGILETHKAEHRGGWVERRPGRTG
jgi:hypothetical protein